ncbi:MAG: amino acid permease [Planctomycetota bacterium]|nr:amino acid permease [Planctomycetota bacterium]
MPLRDHLSKPARETNGATPREGFGAFGGVFTPCTLTILGVIMFLRFGQVIGNTGVWMGLVVVLLAKTITTLTALSLSAIATNTRVRGGGAYFLISRSLGAEFGGSIGVVFFLAQAISVAMYVLGFTEAFLAAFPEVGLSSTAVASVVNMVVFLCVYIGAGWAIRIQYVILALLGLSLVSFFAGALGRFDAANFESNLQAGFQPGESFFTMFALFFPAATGIMAGANMSGDLKDPGKAIPRGTLLSILVTGVIYVAIALCLGGAVDRTTLQTNSLVMEDVALVGLLITVGVFAATLSSALGSMMGAPRILQALGRDEVFERLRFLGQGDGPNNEPRRAIVVTFAICEICLLLGDLNAIAPVITMFFMITYGYLCLATFYESITRNPSYRPTFRWSHWSTALLGAAGCAAVMFLTSPLWAVLSIAAMGLLHRYVARREIIVTWGDAQSGAAYERARRALLKLEQERYHPKNWRPSIIAFSGGAWNRRHLAVYGHWLTASRGVLTLAQVITGDMDEHMVRRRNQEEALRRFIQKEQLGAFPAVLVAPTRDLGMEALIQCHGMGALRPNLVLLGFSEDPDRMERFVGVVRSTTELGRSVALIREERRGRDPWRPPPGPIDVWWRGQDNGHLMVLLAHMLVQNDAWRGRRIRLLRVIGSEAGREEARKHLQELLNVARVPADVNVLVNDDPVATIRQTSHHAAVTFLGFLPPQEGGEVAFAEGTRRFLDGLGTVIMVWSTGEVRLEA